jgi:RNA polymerase sigma-70 factor (ECF subfamily)
VVEKLFKQALDGDEAAYVRLLNLLEQPIYGYFRRRRVAAEDAEDLTQQVFLTLLEQADRFDSERGTLRGFLFGIARRVWLASARKGRQSPGILSAELVDSSSTTPDTALDRAEQLAQIASAIQSLPETAREVLTLRMQENLSIAQIAESMSLPENTVKSHLFRARARLRDQLESTGLEMEGN